MNRDFYFFGIFFLILYMIAGLYNGIIFFHIDYKMYILPSFSIWLLVVLSIALISILFMLKYFLYKNFKLAVITGLIMLVTGLVQHILFYLAYMFLIKDLQYYYIPSVILSLVASLFFVISLLQIKENKWLKTMGIYMLILVGLSVYVLTLSLFPYQDQNSSTLTNLNKWVTLAASIQYIPLVILFYIELENSKSISELRSPYRFADSLSALGGISILMLLIFGFQIGTQSYWTTHISPTLRSMAEPFEAKSYINSDNDTLRYRLLIPQDYDPETEYALVVCLHGGAGYGTDNYRQLDGSLFGRMLSTPENRQKYPAFIFVPQCPPGSSWGGIPGLPSIDELVIETINSVKDEFSIDKDRLYVTGHSLGGYGVWYFIGKHHDMFAAAIPVAGEGDPDLAPHMNDVAIWAFHGANDRNVPVSGSRAVVEAIRKDGGDPLYTESPDGGHSWKMVEDTPGVLDWLFSQKRSDRGNKTYR